MFVLVEIVLIFLSFQTYMYVSAVEDGLELHVIKSMLENYRNLEHEVNIMMENINKLTNMYNRMEMDYIVLKNDHAELKDELTQSKKEIKELRDQQKLLKETTNWASKWTMESGNDTPFSDGSAMNKRLLLPSGTSAPSVQPVVAFTAILTHNVDLGPKQAIEYDKILTNIGNGYDKRNGQFKVPVSGVYIISATVISQASSSMYVEIVKNGVELAGMYGDDYDMGSQTIVVLLNKGDIVWARNWLTNGGVQHVHSHPGLNYCSFAGALIAALEASK